VQSNAIDCRIFALANAVELLVNRRPGSQHLISNTYTRKLLSASLTQALAGQFFATQLRLAGLIVAARVTFASRFTQQNSRHKLVRPSRDSSQVTLQSPQSATFEPSSRTAAFTCSSQTAASEYPLVSLRTAASEHYSASDHYVQGFSSKNFVQTRIYVDR
jgi:hypothetical protein